MSVRQIIRESVMLGGRPLTFETGKLAKLAESSVLVTYGETQVLVTMCYAPPRPGEDLRRRQDPRRLLQARGAPAG